MCTDTEEVEYPDLRFTYMWYDVSKTDGDMDSFYMLYGGIEKYVGQDDAKKMLETYSCHAT